MKTNRILPVLAALSLLLTSCGTQRTASPLPPEAEAVYTAETSPCGLPLADLTAYCVSGDTLYLAGSEEEPAGDAGDEVTGSFSYSGSADGDSMTFSVGGRAAVYRLDPVSGELTKLPDYAPPDGVSIASLAPGPDGTLWVLEQTMGGNLTEMANGSVSYFDPTPASQVWRRLDATGGAGAGPRGCHGGGGKSDRHSPRRFRPVLRRLRRGGHGAGRFWKPAFHL